MTTKDNIFFEANINSATYDYIPSRPDDIDEDYTWGGWYADAKLAQKYVFDIMPGHDLELYAKWVAPSYTVTYVMNGGTPVIEDQTVEK